MKQADREIITVLEQIRDASGAPAEGDSGDSLLLLATVAGVDINTTDRQDVYTVPAGKTLMPLIVTFSEPDAVFDGGGLSSLRVQNEAGITLGTIVVSSATDVARSFLGIHLSTTARTIPAGEKLQVSPNAAYGSANTCTVRVFGILY